MTDAWCASQVAPDGILEDGPHPLEAEALATYLQNTTTSASQAAISITNPIETGLQPKDELCNLWCLLIDALMEFPAHQVRLIELLKAIQQLPVAKMPGDDIIYPVRVDWRTLAGFGDLWADLHQRCCWRDDVKNVDDAARLAGIAEQFEREAVVEAELLLAGLECVGSGWGYDTICDALECRGALIDVEIPAAAAWLVRFSGKYYGDALRTRESWALGRERGFLGMNFERWRLWKERLGVVSDNDVYHRRTRDLAMQALKAMDGAEKGNSGSV